MSETFVNLAGLCYGATIPALFSASTTKGAGIHQAPKAGVISHIGVLTNSIATPPVYEARLETVDSSGNPSGTLVAAGANATFTPAAGLQWIALTTPPTVAKGDGLAAVVQYSSGTIDGTHAATFGRYVYGQIQRGLPYSAYNTGAWSKLANRPCFSLKYNDGTILYGGVPAASILTTAWHAASSPNEYGSVFVPPVKCRCLGVCATIYFTNTSAAGTLTLYDAANNVLASADVSGARFAAVTSHLQAELFWDTPVNLIAGATYRLAFKATSASPNTAGLVVYDLSATAEHASLVGDTALTSRTGSGAWTNAANQMAPISPIVDSLSPAGGALFGFGF